MWLQKKVGQQIFLPLSFFFFWINMDPQHWYHDFLYRYFFNLLRIFVFHWWGWVEAEGRSPLMLVDISLAELASNLAILLRVRDAFLAVLRIHDILVWIRIRIWIRGSMPLTNGSGSGCGSFYFHHWPSRWQQKTNLKKVFCILLFEGIFTSFFKDKNQK